MKTNARELHWSNSAQIVVVIFGGLAALLYFLNYATNGLRYLGRFPIQGISIFLAFIAMCLFTIFVILYLHRKPSILVVPFAIYFGSAFLLNLNNIVTYIVHMHSYGFYTLFMVWTLIKMVMMVVFFVLLANTFYFGRNERGALIVATAYFGISILMLLFLLGISFSLYSLLANLPFFFMMGSLVILLATLKVKKPAINFYVNEPSTASEVICMQCGDTNPADSACCRNCGQPLVEVNTETPN